LEAVYFKKPVVVNAYSIYTKDIKPKGFSVIEIDGYVTEAAVEKTKVVLDNHEFRQQMVAHNYELGVEHFSYSVLHRGLRALLVQRGWIKTDYV
jgi:glycosyltransferase involved in cell wall biosynthesis